MSPLEVSMVMHADDKAAQHMGIEIVESVAGRAELIMTVQEFMSNGHGQCHGGMLFTLCDTAFAHVCNNQNQVTVASGCDINFLRPVPIGARLKAVATEIYQGKKSGLYEVQIVNLDSEKIVAHFTGRAARLSQLVVES